MDSSPPEILLICSLSKTLHSLEEILHASSVSATLADSLQDAEPILAREALALIVCASELIDGTYREVLQILKREHRKVPVVVVNLSGRKQDCEEAMRLGAADCVPRPMTPEDVKSCLEGAFKLMLHPPGDGQRA